MRVETSCSVCSKKRSVTVVKMKPALLFLFGCLILESSVSSSVKRIENGTSVEEVTTVSGNETGQIISAEDAGVKRNVKKVTLKKIRVHGQDKGVERKIIETEVQQEHTPVENKDSKKTELQNKNVRIFESNTSISEDYVDDIGNSTVYQYKSNTISTENEGQIDEPLQNVNKDIEMLESEDYFTESTTAEYDPKKFERRSDNFGDESFIEDEVKSTRKTSPKLDKDMVELAFKEDQDKKIRSLLEEQHDPKKMQRRTFDILGMLGLGEEKKHKSVIKITKEVAVSVPYTIEKKIQVPVKVEVEHPVPVQIPKLYPVTVEKKVYYPVKEYIHAPYPVYKKVPYLVKFAVEKPVPVHIEKPYPVYIEKKVPYPVEKQIHYPVKIPVDRPIPIHIPVVKNVYYPVEKKVVYPVPVPVEKPVAVPVEKPYPVYIEKKVPIPVETHVPHPIPVEDHKLTEDASTYSIESHKFGPEQSFVPSDQIKIDFQSGEYGKTDGGFLPLVEKHDHAKLQEKKDEEAVVEDTKKTENVEDKPTWQTQEEKRDGEKIAAKDKDTQEFGRKIKKT